MGTARSLRWGGVQILGGDSPCGRSWLEQEVFMALPLLGAASASQVYSCSELCKHTW